MGFSVLMSVYRKENFNYLNEALQSVIQQTLVPDEIVLMEDGPLTKELYKVIEENRKKFPALRTYQFKQNVQLGRALAKGVRLCRNDLIARMDSDDIAVNNRFEVQHRYMLHHPEISAVGGFIQEFSDDDSAYHKYKEMPENMLEIKKYARYRNPLNHMTVMFRKSAVLQAGNYRHFPYLEDYDLWCRMLANNCELHNLQQVLVKARTGNELYVRRGGKLYCKNYLKLRKQQKMLGLLGFLEYIISVNVTLGMTLQPTKFRQIFYQKFLRK